MVFKELWRSVGDRSGAADPDRARDDLAEAVRPRRPHAVATSTLRPQIPPVRMAPLVLVVEQHTDGGSQPELVVIRPRRVTSRSLASDEAQDGADGIVGDGKAMSEFVHRAGATELPDLLEAIAAYAACVEGRAQFSRSQILRSASDVSGKELNRETCLRSFWMLLRQGKIQKVTRGEFAISKTSRFLSEARNLVH